MLLSISGLAPQLLANMLALSLMMIIITSYGYHPALHMDFLFYRMKQFSITGAHNITVKNTNGQFYTPIMTLLSIGTLQILLCPLKTLKQNYLRILRKTSFTTSPPSPAPP